MRFNLLLLMLALSFAHCAEGQGPDKMATPLAKQEDHLKGIFHAKSGIYLDSSAIEQFLIQYPLLSKFKTEYYTFYQQNDNQFVWFDQHGLIEQAGLLWNKLHHTEEEGMMIKIPYEEELGKHLHGDSSLSSTQDKLHLELLLTGDYFHYVDRIIGGKVADKRDNIGWYLPKKKMSYATVLQQSLVDATLVSDSAPLLKKQYQVLRSYLNYFQQIEKEGDILQIATTKSMKIRPGDSSTIISDGVKKMALLLQQEVKPLQSNFYSPVLIDLVNKSRYFFGLKTDSTIDESLIKELNKPIGERIKQLVVNMERLRWLPGNVEADEYIFVNIPEYKLHYFENSKEVWSCNVVVGKPLTKTVIFSGNMKYVHLSPYWYVPTSIIQKEVVPGMRRNSNYLASHNMEWNGGHVRQKPGPNNSLGRVKFIFPNSNNIYLHDTPAKSLFNKDERAFSHGCVRVGAPRDLAIRVLAQDKSWTIAKIDAAMNKGQETIVTLKKQIPVYIAYFTAFVDSNNQLQLLHDVYQRDARLYNMLME